MGSIEKGIERDREKSDGEREWQSSGQGEEGKKIMQDLQSFESCSRIIPYFLYVCASSLLAPCLLSSCFHFQLANSIYLFVFQGLKASFSLCDLYA